MRIDRSGVIFLARREEREDAVVGELLGFFPWLIFCSTVEIILDLYSKSV
jgi:hypothetical protein